MSFKVFISYSTKDLSRAKQIKKSLEEVGSAVYVAEINLNPGQDLAVTIVSEIKQCDLFILLWSSHAKYSNWVPQEIGIAKGLAKPIIPIMLHKNLELPGFLGGTKYLPLYKSPEKNLKWLVKNVFDRSQKKKRSDGLLWLGLGAILIGLLSSESRD